MAAQPAAVPTSASRFRGNAKPDCLTVLRALVKGMNSSGSDWPMPCWSESDAFAHAACSGRTGGEGLVTFVVKGCCVSSLPVHVASFMIVMRKRMVGRCLDGLGVSVGY